MCCVFININIIEPVRGLSLQMGTKVSVFEPFVALSNSGLVLLLIPIMFIVLMSEFPDNSAFQFFYSIRLSKSGWVMIQLLSIHISTFVFILFIFLFSVIMSSDCSSFQTGFSDAVRYYSARFPELSYSYAAQLFPLNMGSFVFTGLALRT